MNIQQLAQTILSGGRKEINTYQSLNPQQMLQQTYKTLPKNEVVGIAGMSSPINSAYKMTNLARSESLLKEAENLSKKIINMRKANMLESEIQPFIKAMNHHIDTATKLRSIINKNL